MFNRATVPCHARHGALGVAACNIVTSYAAHSHRVLAAARIGRVRSASVVEVYAVSSVPASMRPRHAVILAGSWCLAGQVCHSLDTLFQREVVRPCCRRARVFWRGQLDVPSRVGVQGVGRSERARRACIADHVLVFGAVTLCNRRAAIVGRVCINGWIIALGVAACNVVATYAAHPHRVSVTFGIGPVCSASVVEVYAVFSVPASMRPRHAVIPSGNQCLAGQVCYSLDTLRQREVVRPCCRRARVFWRGQLDVPS